MAAIDLEFIQELLAEDRTRGKYMREAKEFFESGELYVDLSAKYPKKEATSLKTSFDQNIKKIEGHPEYKLLFQKNGDGETKHLLLVNMDVYHLAEQQQNEA